MARMKTLAGYLVSRCKDWLDLDEAEFRAICKDAAVDPEDFTATFSHAEKINETTVRWWFDCKACNKKEFKDYPIENDFVYVGSCPSEEKQDVVSFVSCTALIRQMRATIGKEPEGARLGLKSEADGFYEVVVRFNNQFPLAVAYAYLAEDSLPAHWTPTSKKHIEELKKHC